tara:strand:- start:42 stop:740 length:699 start_codon:yes stop_codon:yes gene_type:complete
MATNYNKGLLWEKEDTKIFLNPNDRRSYSGSGTALTNMANGGDFTIENGATITDNYFNFDGTNDFLNGPATNAIIGDNNVNYTLGCWLKFTTGGGYIFNIKRSTSASTLFSLQNTSSANKIGLLFRTQNDVSHTWMNSTSNYNDGNWHYLVGVADTGSVKLYINGSLESTNTSDNGVQSTSGNTGSVAVGAFEGAGNEPFNGSIAYPTLYNRSLTADEISKNYFAMRGRFGV